MEDREEGFDHDPPSLVLCSLPSYLGALAPWRSFFPFPFVILAVALTACLAFLLPGHGAALQYDRDGIASGEIWRVLTCHLTHWTAGHLSWDVLCFIALGLACHARALSRARMTWVLLLSALLIPAGLRLWMPDLSTYRGLSGIVSGLFALLAVTLLRDCRRGDRRDALLAAVVATALLCKMAFDLRLMIVGPVIDPSAPFIAIPLAHFVGGAVGGLCGLVGRRVGS
jgi:rhomboid family GlyGly-CTERM serine protease